AVVAAAPGAGKLLAADREGDAAVRALVVEGVDPAAFATEHDAVTQHRERDRLLADLAGPRDRGPVIPEAEHRRIILRPWAQIPLTQLRRRPILHAGFP